MHIIFYYAVAGIEKICYTKKTLIEHDQFEDKAYEQRLTFGATTVTAAGQLTEMSPPRGGVLSSLRILDTSNYAGQVVQTGGMCLKDTVCLKDY